MTTPAVPRFPAAVGGAARRLVLTVWGLLSLGACSAGASWQTPGSGLEASPGVYERRITGRHTYAEIAMMPGAFRRPTDPYVGPVFLLFAEGGRLACLVEDADYVKAVEGTMWLCRWRPPR